MFTAFFNLSESISRYDSDLGYKGIVICSELLGEGFAGRKPRTACLVGKPELVGIHIKICSCH